MAMPALLGVDVGFSQTRKSTGLAWLINGQVDTALTGTSWLERSSDLPRGIKFVLAALDAPIVHDDQAATRRRCEFVFYGGAFSKRCRPGLSHYGRGLLLREAGRQSMRDFAQALMPGEPISGPLVVANLPVIEAFPNTFMGVLIPENYYSD
jgi:hypothetical protein